MKPDEVERIQRGDVTREVLRFDSVMKRYGDVVAIDEVSFTLEQGKFVVLLGPSGCGKTTTLRLAAGFEQPNTGAIYIDERSMAGVPAYRRPVNTVFQDFGLFPHMSVFDNVAFGPRMQNVPRGTIESRVGKMLELVQLSKMASRRPHQLSGGQQQRVALARALANTPTILLLDEPLSNLDYKLRKEMRVELKRIRREVNGTFVLVTHDQEEALTVADYVIVMNAGRIQQMGTPLELYRSPANTFVANFIGATNFLEGTIQSRSGVNTKIRLNGLAQVALGPDTDADLGSSVVLCIRAGSIGLSNVQPHEDGNGLRGTVEEILYMGDHSDLFVRLPNSKLIHCQQVHHGGKGVGFQMGDEIYLTWRPEESLVFRG